MTTRRYRTTVCNTTYHLFAWVTLSSIIGMLYFHPPQQLSYDEDDTLLSVLQMSKTQSYKLAYDQSFGFFDDITDKDWKRAQLIHSRMFPNHFGKDLLQYSSGMKDKSNPERLSPSRSWNGENFQEEFHCKLAQRIQTTGQADGPKWVCDPHRLTAKKDCLVYSVGSNGKPEFEQGVKEEIGEHCEIHTFDLKASNKRFGQFEEKLKPHATFHHWGLGTEAEAAAFKATGKGARIKTLEQTIDELGHRNRTIDIFKIDCEWCEWSTYKQWLMEDLRQILVESHNAPMPNARDFFYDMHDAGYVIFSKEANFVNGADCAEWGFVKLSTAFFGNQSMYKNLPLDPLLPAR
jgi:hypothetical protein